MHARVVGFSGPAKESLKSARRLDERDDLVILVQSIADHCVMLEVSCLTCRFSSIPDRPSRSICR